jgi:hypothetical protein
MTGDARKAMTAAYKERKSVPGIYALRCRVTGVVWVGQTPTLDTVQNRIWFTLRFGSNPNRELQQAWNDHGADSFAFEVVERLEEEDAYLRCAVLKERLTHWQAKLNAAALL